MIAACPDGGSGPVETIALRARQREEGEKYDGNAKEAPFREEIEEVSTGPAEVALEDGWIRRTYKTNSWKGTLMVINTVGHSPRRPGITPTSPPPMPGSRCG